MRPGDQSRFHWEGLARPETLNEVRRAIKIWGTHAGLGTELLSSVMLAGYEAMANDGLRALLGVVTPDRAETTCARLMSRFVATQSLADDVAVLVAHHNLRPLDDSAIAPIG
jgi:hypothetical protein